MKYYIKPLADSDGKHAKQNDLLERGHLESHYCTSEELQRGITMSSPSWERITDDRFRNWLLSVPLSEDNGRVQNDQFWILRNRQWKQKPTTGQ